MKPFGNEGRVIATALAELDKAEATVVEYVAEKAKAQRQIDEVLANEAISREEANNLLRNTREIVNIVEARMPRLQARVDDCAEAVFGACELLVVALQGACTEERAGHIDRIAEWLKPFCTQYPDQAKDIAGSLPAIRDLGFYDTAGARNMFSWNPENARETAANATAFLARLAEREGSFLRAKCEP